MIKRERIGNTLGEDQYIAIKVRHKPFSVYMNFLAPSALKGQECMFIEGANNGKMWAHGTGMKAAFGTVSLKPDGDMAMAGQRYPLTQVGILNLTKRLIEVASEDVKYGECEVKYFKGARSTTAFAPARKSCIPCRGRTSSSTSPGSSSTTN